MRNLIIGAGPAGLSAAYILSKNKYQKVKVLEKSSKYVGGLSKTVEKNGFKFDIGGHRFYTKHKEVQDIWSEILNDSIFVERSRKSRILFNKQFFSYPIKVMECFKIFSLLQSSKILLSYIFSLLYFNKKINNFEDWVVKKLGRELYSLFFKTYTEKVWGIPCDEISKDWAEQRIQGLSIWTIVKSEIYKKFKVSSLTPKTLIEKFRYPMNGPGQMWDSCRKIIEKNSGEVLLGAEYISAKRSKDQWVVRYSVNEQIFEEVFDNIISTLPIGTFIKSIENIDSNIKELSDRFKHRDFLTIALMTHKDLEITDNWIYIHDTDVDVARVQFYHNWSESMTPSADKGCIGLEYFCDKDEELWNSTNEELREKGIKEAVDLNLIKSKEDVMDYMIVRAPFAYPIYHENYKDDLKKIEKYLKLNFPNIYLSGRNGLHRYNNQDHSILTSIACSEQILNVENARDPWSILEQMSYLECR